MKRELWNRIEGMDNRLGLLTSFLSIDVEYGLVSWVGGDRVYGEPFEGVYILDWLERKVWVGVKEIVWWESYGTYPCNIGYINENEKYKNRIGNLRIIGSVQQLDVWREVGHRKLGRLYWLYNARRMPLIVTLGRFKGRGVEVEVSEANWRLEAEEALVAWRYRLKVRDMPLLRWTNIKAGEIWHVGEEDLIVVDANGYHPVNLRLCNEHVSILIGKEVNDSRSDLIIERRLEK
jgi:hypothetical protein